VLSFRGWPPGGLTYAPFSYQAQFGQGDGRRGVYRAGIPLGAEFANLGAHGTAQIASVRQLSLIRSRNTNLYALAGFDAKTFNDKID